MCKPSEKRGEGKRKWRMKAELTLALVPDFFLPTSLNRNMNLLPHSGVFKGGQEVHSVERIYHCEHAG